VSHVLLEKSTDITSKRLDVSLFPSFRQFSVVKSNTTHFLLGAGDFDRLGGEALVGAGLGGKISVSISCPKNSLAAPMHPQMLMLS